MQNENSRPSPKCLSLLDNTPNYLDGCVIQKRSFSSFYGSLFSNVFFWQFSWENDLFHVDFFLLKFQKFGHTDYIHIYEIFVCAQSILP